MLVLALSVFILTVGENTGDIQVVLNLLEDVIVSDESFYRRYRKDSGVLTISRLSFMVLNNVVGDQGHSLFGEIEFTHINSIGKRRIVPIKIAFHRLDVFDMETEDIVIEDSVLDQIVMYALAEEHFGGLSDLAFRFAVHFKARRTGEAEELSLLEVAYNVLVHITELTAVTLVDDEDNLFVSICAHNLRILRTLDCVRHLLHRSDDELPVLILHLFNKNIGAICCVNRANFKLIELFCGLRVQVLPVYKEDDFLDVGIGCEDLRCLKRCQRLSSSGCMPDISISVG